VKLIIQIPCLNEAATLAQTLEDLPRDIEGISQVEWLVIDDGSTDGTAEIARELGVHHIIRHPMNLGLARAFMTGLEYAIAQGADIIVNTDADNQYSAHDMPALLVPILKGTADFVIGERPVDEIETFSYIKKILQKLGSRIVRAISGTHVRDAPSGFRAMSRAAAIQLNVFTNYTYTLETIIQAGHKGIAIANVPVQVNPSTRKSRLVKNIPAYLSRSIQTMLRVLIIYRPLRFFIGLAALFFLPGFILGMRFVLLYLQGNGEGNIQSLLLATLLMGTGFLLIVAGIISDLIAVNRRLLERVQSLLLSK